MAKSHKFKSLEDLTTVFPEVPWRASAAGDVSIYDEKTETYVPVEKGNYVVSIGDRFEVAEEEPEKAKPAEAPKKTAAAKDDADESEDRPNASGVGEASGIESGNATKTNE